MVPCPAVAVEVHRYHPSLSVVQRMFSSLPSWFVNGILSIPSHLNVGPGLFFVYLPLVKSLSVTAMVSPPLHFPTLVFCPLPRVLLRGGLFPACVGPRLASASVSPGAQSVSASLCRVACVFSVSQGLRLSDVCSGTLLGHCFSRRLSCSSCCVSFTRELECQLPSRPAFARLCCTSFTLVNQCRLPWRPAVVWLRPPRTS